MQALFFDSNLMAQTLKNSYWLRDETERLLMVKLWITPMVVFTKAIVKFGKPVKRVRVVNCKFLLRTLQSERGNSASTSIIWANREQLVDRLTG